jgi:putative transposase
MNTYTQILYQIIFAAKNHEKTLTTKNHPDLYKYIWGILKNKYVYLE